MYLIHGDQVEASREKLLMLKRDVKAQEIRELTAKRLEPTALIQALESPSLFGGGVLVVIEGLLTGARKREKSFAETITRLVAASEDIDVALYEEKEIDKTTVAKLGPRAHVFLFKTPTVLFQLLDNFRPGNANASLRTLHEVIERQPAEIVFALLVRRVRQLIQCADGVTPDGLQSWQAARLTSQARHFTMEQLVAMHAQLLEIDIAIKTSSSPFTLAQQLEQLVIAL